MCEKSLLSKENSIINSPYRQKINNELKSLLETSLAGHSLIKEIFYHLRLDSAPSDSVISHSKRLRGHLCLLIADILGVDISRVMPVACAIELYHNATLIIDDIEDASETRCNRDSLWKKSGISQAINVAWILKSCAELTLLNQKSENFYYRIVLEKLIKGIILIGEGQTLDLNASQLWREGLDYYYKVVGLKTGVLLGIACEIGSLSRLSQEKAREYYDFGLSLGVAHQIEDDIEDIILFMKNDAQPIDPGNFLNFIITEQHNFNATSAIIQKDMYRNLICEESIINNINDIRLRANQEVLNKLNDLTDVSLRGKTILEDLVYCLLNRNKDVLENLK